MDNKYYSLEIKAPDECYDQLAGLLALEAAFGWEEQTLANGDTIFRLHCEDASLLEDIAKKAATLCGEASFVHGEAEKTDWLAAWKDFFTPVECGKQFVIIPPWLANDDYGGRRKILIEPKCAFGTGHHATTALCLEALDMLICEGLVHAGQEFLDLGCGSGVLAIAACKAGLSGVGLDTDPLAITNAMENRTINDAADLVLEKGSLELVSERHFDLIMANILARPLMELAPGICACLKPGGSLILSGVLDIQAGAVERAYMACGLPEAKILERDEWRCLVFAAIS